MFLATQHNKILWTDVFFAIEASCVFSLQFKKAKKYMKKKNI